MHSDVDLLVEYESGKHPGLDHFRIAEELSELFGRKVDLNTPTMLGRHLEEVLAGARLLDAMRDAWPEVPWRQIISMRNWLIHGYDGIDLEILWDVLDLRSRELTVQLDEITKAEKMI